jgi:hypothetical protein
MIYLAGPYAHVYEHMKCRRYEQLTFVTAMLLRSGTTVYSPITHCHPLAQQYDMPRDHSFWLNHDLAILARCDKLLVLRLEGWENSIGLRREIEFANEKNIPIEYIDLEDFCGEHNQHSGS